MGGAREGGSCGSYLWGVGRTHEQGNGDGDTGKMPGLGHRNSQESGRVNGMHGRELVK